MQTPTIVRMAADLQIEWPADWQEEAIAAVLPYLDSDEQLRIVVGPPETSLSGTVLGGHVYVGAGVPMVIHDRSGRPDVYPWRLLGGPVLWIELLRARRRPLVLHAHPNWPATRP